MTEIYIDKTAVVLPKEFSFKTFDENPRYTKNGSYSLDIDLSLNNVINSRLYRHINRIHSRAIFTGRSVIIKADGNKEFVGKEVILGFTNSTVRIQIIAGNSDLNFNLREDKIRNLNLGSVTYKFISDPDTNPDNFWIADNEPFEVYLNQRYPSKNFIHAPFYAEDAGQFCNQWLYTNQSAPGIPTLGPNGLFVAQPYISAIINKIIKYYGYTVEHNDIELDQGFSELYIVHGYNTNEYAKMLPDWTVKEFFEQIEKLFNCTLIVNPQNQAVSIVFNNQYFKTSDTNVLKMIDAYECENNPENTIDYSNANIGYDLDDCLYYRYARLDKRIDNMALSDSYVDAADLYAKINDAADIQRHIKIFSGPLGDFISRKIPDSTYFLAQRVNEMKDLSQNQKEDLDITFKIMPAPMKQVIDYVYDMGSVDNYPYWNQYPVVLKSEKYDQANLVNIDDVLTQELELPEEKLQSKMYLAVYTGMQLIDYVNDVPSYSLPGIPMSYTTYLASYFDGRQEPRFFQSGGALKLERLKDTKYNSDEVDTTRKFRISFIANKNIDIRNFFNFNNKLYACIRLEKTFNHKGLNQIFSGDFYPLK
ncbi:MAG: hypothetical protein PHU68_01300 [Paludibacter sp.]|nr:hypothetical protein [Paludibacter sp.]